MIFDFEIDSDDIIIIVSLKMFKFGGIAMFVAIVSIQIINYWSYNYTAISYIAH